MRTKSLLSLGLLLLLTVTAGCVSHSTSSEKDLWKVVKYTQENPNGK